MPLPRLLPQDAKAPAAAADSVVFAVYAPFGSDETLSTYPDGASQTLAKHPLYTGLLEVAANGVHVAALIDRTHDYSWLLEIDAGKPETARVSTRGKQAMESPLNLAAFLRHVHASRPESAIVLALEGHGAGYMPEIDRRQLTAQRVTEDGRFEWHLGAGGGNPVLPAGSPLLPAGSPLLPAGSPLLPAEQMPLSTWGLGHALRTAMASGVPKLRVIHFDNCFNMSVEVMHTVSPYADYATGYPNYNFFTAGQPYPQVFKRLAQQGGATAGELARWFAEGNRDLLEAKGNHPTAGCVVPLARMEAVAEAVDDLADALLAALRAATVPKDREDVIGKIMQAIDKAQQYDTEAGFALETPDELTDLYSLAQCLAGFDFKPHPVLPACQALIKLLDGVCIYGSRDRPWVVPTASGIVWDFSSKQLAMNIFLPDPLRKGLWDWRSPFYLQVNPEKVQPPVQPHVIEFLKMTDWVDFLIEYHRDAPFLGLRPAEIPKFPVFNASYEPGAPCPPKVPGKGHCPGPWPPRRDPLPPVGCKPIRRA